MKRKLAGEWKLSEQAARSGVGGGAKSKHRNFQLTARQMSGQPAAMPQETDSEGRAAEYRLKAYCAEQLRDIRSSTSWSQTEIAAELGRSQGQVSRYETGQREIPAEDLARIARLLETPVEEFFPPDLWRSKLPAEEAELLRAWRRCDLKRLLALVGEKFAR